MNHGRSRNLESIGIYNQTEFIQLESRGDISGLVELLDRRKRTRSTKGYFSKSITSGLATQTH